MLGLENIYLLIFTANECTVAPLSIGIFMSSLSSSQIFRFMIFLFGRQAWIRYPVIKTI